MDYPRPQAEEVAGASASTGLSAEEVRDYMRVRRVSSLERVKLGKFKEVGRIFGRSAVGSTAVGSTAVGSDRVRPARPPKRSACTCLIDPPPFSVRVRVRCDDLLRSAYVCASGIATYGGIGGMG